MGSVGVHRECIAGQIQRYFTVRILNTRVQEENLRNDWQSTRYQRVKLLLERRRDVVSRRIYVSYFVKLSPVQTGAWIGTELIPQF
jgi:hypothetical protein